MRIKLGVPMSLFEIAKGANGRLITEKNVTIKAITTDTRELRPGDLFIALKGSKYDGENYTADAKKMGSYTLSSDLKNADILHSDTGDALLSLAGNYIKTLPYILYIIGITGSVGKSTTKEFLKIILQKQYITHSSDGNFNNEIGMPMSILSAPENTQILIMEMGMNHKGEISKLSKCLRPNIGIITNIGSAHIGNLGSRENIAKAKLEIEDGMNEEILFVPYDEPLLFLPKNRITFSTDNTCANFSLLTIEKENLKLYKNGKECFNLSFSPTGEHHKKCLVSALSVAMFIGMPPEMIKAGVSTISDNNIRQKCIFRENYTFYADFYNASYESVSALIKVASEIVLGRRKSLVLGDILELGDMSEQIHFEVGKMISPDEFNYLFLFGKEAKNIGLGAIHNGFPKERIFINTDLSAPQTTALRIREVCPLGEAIFMKASRGIRLERILDCFNEKKGGKNE